jgi:hypothetical protein
MDLVFIANKFRWVDPKAMIKHYALRNGQEQWVAHQSVRDGLLKNLKHFARNDEERAMIAFFQDNSKLSRCPSCRVSVVLSGDMRFSRLLPSFGSWFWSQARAGGSVAPAALPPRSLVGVVVQLAGFTFPRKCSITAPPTVPTKPSEPSQYLQQHHVFRTERSILNKLFY